MPRIIVINNCSECRHRQRERCFHPSSRWNSRVDEEGIPNYCPLEEPVCIRCEGRGWVPDYIQGYRYYRLKQIPCPDCEGSGVAQIVA